DERSAALVVAPGRGGSAAGTATPEGDTGGDRLAEAFTALVATRALTPVSGLLAAALAVGLGALHAFAPGHGKTVVAAYLLGRQGTPRQALGLGLTVALTHTVGVLVLGLVLSATDAVAPDRLYPLLGGASGALFAVVGLLLLRQALRARRHGQGRRHDLDGGDHSHDHGHHGQDHGRDHEHVHEHVHGGITWRSLVAPGLAGGMVPSPSALVVLLGGVAIGRAGFGVVLVLAYGIGMATALVGAGFLLTRARARLELRAQQSRWRRMERVSALLPLVTACLVTTGGIVLALRAVVGG
nr:High-affinity nickel-transporter [Euzebyales bacterium]